MIPASHTLARHGLFRTLDAASLARVDAACTWSRADAKEWVVDAHSHGTDVFFVLHGHVRVVVSAAGRNTILRDIREGAFFGELAALDNQPRAAGIQAVTDCLLARMPAAAFRLAVHEHPDVCDQVMAVLVGQVRMLANRANEHTGLTMKQRLVAELLRLSRPAAASDSHVVTPPPTHAELAQRVSSHREAVTRQLSALERAGLIARRRGAIALLDTGRMQRMVTENSEG